MNFGLAIMAIIAAAVLAASCSTQPHSLFANISYATTESAS